MKFSSALLSSSVSHAAAWLVTCGLLSSSLSMGEEADLDSASAGDTGLKNTAQPLDLPHIQQRSGTRLCGPAVVLTAYQRQTGLNLINLRLIERLGAIVRKPGEGSSPPALYDPLNFNFSEVNFLADSNIADLKTARRIALDKLRKEIIPNLKRGAFYSLMVTSADPYGHAILVTGYDPQGDKLTIHDPLLKSADDVSVSFLANKWTFKYPDGDHYILKAEKLEFAPCSELRDPPENACVSISSQAFQGLKIPEVLSAGMIGNENKSSIFAQNTAWKNLSNNWEGRNPSSVLGVADVVRIKVAQGDPPLMLFRKGDDVRVVVVSGYRGGYCNPKGKIQITFMHEGKMVSGWLGVADFLEKCSPRQDDGKYGCYIGYPAVSLKNPEQTIESIAKAVRFTEEVDITRIPNKFFMIEGEKLVASAKTSGGNVAAQALPGIFSAGAQLWWKEGKPGDYLRVSIGQEHLVPGTYDVSLYPTMANDYAIVKITLDGKEQTVDLFSKELFLGPAVTFENVTVNPDAPPELLIEIVGKNNDAIPSHMAGFDRLVWKKRAGSEGDKKDYIDTTDRFVFELPKFFIMEGEKMVASAKPSGGIVEAQALPGNFSAGAQLWWKEGKPGDHLRVSLGQEGLDPGTYDVSFYPTTANDYAIVKITLHGKEQTVDLFSKELLPGPAVTFENVTVNPDAPPELLIEIVGKNNDAIPSHMAGIDRLVWKKRDGR